MLHVAFFFLGVAVGWLLDTVLEGHRRRTGLGRYAGAYTGRCPDCRGKYPRHKWHCRWRPI